MNEPLPEGWVWVALGPQDHRIYDALAAARAELAEVTRDRNGWRALGGEYEDERDAARADADRLAEALRRADASGCQDTSMSPAEALAKALGSSWTVEAAQAVVDRSPPGSALVTVESLAASQHERWAPGFCISDLGEHAFADCDHQRIWLNFAASDIEALR